MSCGAVTKVSLCTCMAFIFVCVVLVPSIVRHIDIAIRPSTVVKLQYNPLQQQHKALHDTSPPVKENTTESANHEQIYRESHPPRINNMIRHPHHEGYVDYYMEISPDMRQLIYVRQFNVPCGYGLLVFNVGPAANYAPYVLDIYDDAYVYSDNDGLCFFYPSYTGIQKGDEPFWSINDDDEKQVVPLGSIAHISSRIVILPNTKPYDNSKHRYLAGDYAIISRGNFYTPAYYQQLRIQINNWATTGSSSPSELSSPS